jgi:hypothetical protein
MLAPLLGRGSEAQPLQTLHHDTQNAATNEGGRVAD